MTERLNVIVYDGKDADGFGAAYAAARCFRAEGRPFVLVPAFHGKPINFPPLAKSAKVYFFDFCPLPDVLIDLLYAVGFIKIIDHHKTTRDHFAQAFAHFGRPGTECSFFDAYVDTEHSAAVLAWAYFAGCLPSEVPDLFKYIDDRDRWQWKLPQAREITAALDTYEYNLSVWDSLVNDFAMLRPRLVAKGEALIQQEQQRVAKLVDLAQAVQFRGPDDRWHVIPAVNCPNFHASDVGDVVLKTYPLAPFAASYYTDAEGETRISLRSSEGRIDVSEVALVHGGGGHRNAAGIGVTADGLARVMVPLRRPYKEFAGQ